MISTQVPNDEKTRSSHCQDCTSSSRFPLIDLYQAAPEGSPERSRLLSQLTTKHIGLVKKQASKYSGFGVEFDDLLQAGFLGLQESFARFDQKKGYRFSTYAVFWIRRFILLELDGQRPIRLPKSAGEIARKTRAILDKGFSLQEAAVKLNQSYEYVFDCFYGSQTVDPLPVSINGEYLVTEGEVSAAPYPHSGILEELDPDIRETVLLRSEGWTYKAIAELLGKPLQLIKSWYKKAIEWLENKRPKPQHRKDLVGLAAEGDNRALRKLVAEHKHLILSAVNRCDDRTDKNALVSAGEEAVHIAAIEFDPDKGAQFATYLTKVLQTKVKERYCDETGQTKYSLGNNRKISQVKEAVYRDLGREATLEEISEYSGLSLRQIENAYQSRNFAQPYSLNSSGDEDRPEYLDSCTDTSAYTWEQSESQEFIESLEKLEIYGYLEKRQVSALIARYQGFNFADIGEHLEIGAERVRQIVCAAKDIVQSFLSGELVLPASCRVDISPSDVASVEKTGQAEGSSSAKDAPVKPANRLGDALRKGFNHILSASKRGLENLANLPKYFAHKQEKEKMLKKTLFVGSVLLAAQFPAIANPSSVPIDRAFGETQRLTISQGVSHYLDFSDTGYHVTKAYPSNPNQFVGVQLSASNTQQLVLTWTPNSTAKMASIAIELSGPGGTKTLTVLAKRSKGEPKTIRTVFSPSPKSNDFVAIGEPVQRNPVPSKKDEDLIRPDWRSQSLNKPISISAPSSQPKPVKLGRISDPTPKIKLTPKPVSKVARVSASGRRLIDRSTLSKKALANYLIRGLHRARGRREINRYHDNYWYAQSMARLLRADYPIERALIRSKLPRKTFDDLLGHGGVSK